MCQFKSAIVVRDEGSKGGFRLLLSPWTESHSELETLFKLRDGKIKPLYAKVEFSPKDLAEAYKVETYKLTIDEERKPDWFDGEMQEKVAAKLADYIKSIIVDGDVELLIGGQFIVAPKARIGRIGIATVNSICSATVGSIYGSATVGSIYGSARVDNIYDSATVGSICDSAKIINDKRVKP
jgi:hypothetical protein